MKNPIGLESENTMRKINSTTHVTRRHGVAITLGLLLVGSVAYGIDARLDNDSLHAANDALGEQVDAATARHDEAATRVTELEDEVDTWAAREQELQDREDAVADDEAAVAEQKAAVAEREKAVTAVEKKIEATQTTDGTWSVGTDIQPGSYRTTEPVAADCYWKITAGGSNGSDIVENDFPGGGYPVVTLQDGQVFTSARCGTWAKQ